MKQQFVEDLRDTVDKVLASDVLIVLGDFNACVGREWLVVGNIGMPWFG